MSFNKTSKQSLILSYAQWSSVGLLHAHAMSTCVCVPLALSCSDGSLVHSCPQVHRALMLLAIPFTIAGFVVIFVSQSGFMKPLGVRTYNAHTHTCPQNTGAPITYQVPHWYHLLLLLGIQSKGHCSHGHWVHVGCAAVSQRESPLPLHPSHCLQQQSCLIVITITLLHTTLTTRYSYKYLLNVCIISYIYCVRGVAHHATCTVECPV